MKITLEPIKHVYLDEVGIEYKSVTRFINQFAPQFDFEQKSKAYASKYGMSVEKVREDWSSRNKNSTDFGTKVHSLIESAIKDRESSSDNMVKDIVDTLYNSFRGIFHTEHTVYDGERRIAGTSDLIIEDGDSFSIVDFKTNKKIKYTNEYEDKFLLKPISHLPNSEYFKYSLQLSFYAYFYSNITGKKLDRLCFFWLKRANAENYDDFSKSKWVRYNIPYLKEEVESCLNYAG